MEIKAEKNQKAAGSVMSIDCRSREEKEEEVAGYGNEVYTLTSKHHFFPTCVGREKILLISE